MENKSQPQIKYLKILLAILSILLYFGFCGAMFGMNFSSIVNNTQFFSVTVGIVLLTLSQYRRGMNFDLLVHRARQNAILAGGITTLFALMKVLSQPHIGNRPFAAALLPLLYGALWYALFSMEFLNREPQSKSEDELLKPMPKLDISLERAYPLLTKRGFTPREIHVALRILTNSANKEIAEDLFISEATVKKHIQNMFKKCGALDRQDFMRLYLSWLEQ